MWSSLSALPVCLPPSPPPEGDFSSPHPSPCCWSITVGMSFAAEGLGCCQPDSEFSSHLGAALHFLLSHIWQKKEEFYPASFQGGQVGMSPRRPQEWEQETETRLLPSLSPLLWLFRLSEGEDGPTLALLPVSWLWVPSYGGAQTAWKCYQLLGLWCRLIREILRCASSVFSGFWLFNII